MFMVAQAVAPSWANNYHCQELEARRVWEAWVPFQGAINSPPVGAEEGSAQEQRWECWPGDEFWLFGQEWVALRGLWPGECLAGVLLPVPGVLLHLSPWNLACQAGVPVLARCIVYGDRPLWPSLPPSCRSRLLRWGRRVLQLHRAYSICSGEVPTALASSQPDSSRNTL